MKEKTSSLLGLGTLYCVELHGKEQRHKRGAIVMLHQAYFLAIFSSWRTYEYAEKLSFFLEFSGFFS